MEERNQLREIPPMYSLDNSPRGRINLGPLLGGVIIAQGAGLIPAPYWVE